MNIAYILQDKINSKNSEVTQVGYILQKYTLDKYTFDKLGSGRPSAGRA